MICNLFIYLNLKYIHFLFIILKFIHTKLVQFFLIFIAHNKNNLIY